MVTLKLRKETKVLGDGIPENGEFLKPFIFYLINKDDARPFFITFVIADFYKNELVFYHSYSDKNVAIINKQDMNEIFTISNSPHCTLVINEDKDFLTFMEEEEFLIYVNYKEAYMKVFTFNDLLPDSDICFKRISSTIYKDDNDPECFYVSVVDTSHILHVYQISLSLEYIKELDSFPGYPYPPHVVRKFKDYLFLSHDFYYPQYILGEERKIMSREEMLPIMLRYALQVINSDCPNNINLDYKNLTISKAQTEKLYQILKRELLVKCLPGKILMLNLINKDKFYCETTGGSPAHFEIDVENDYIYTSSHNFLSVDFTILKYWEPAVIDKFYLSNGKLNLQGSFTYPKGYRYTTHKAFYFNGKSYLCTFAQPNRLLFIDAETMKMIFYYDVGQDELSAPKDTGLYLSTRKKGAEYVAIEVSENGRYIFFIDSTYIYLFSFPERRIVKQFNFIGNSPDLSNYYSRTIHFNFFE